MIGLLFGILLAGTLTWLLLEDFFQRFADQELLSLLVMPGIGIPLYICASLLVTKEEADA